MERPKHKFISFYKNEHLKLEGLTICSKICSQSFVDRKFLTVCFPRSFFILDVSRCSFGALRMEIIAFRIPVFNAVSYKMKNLGRCKIVTDAADRVGPYFIVRDYKVN